MPFGDVREGAGFYFEKSQSGKNDQKRSKWYRNGVFGLFRKIASLVFSGNGVK